MYCNLRLVERLTIEDYINRLSVSVNAFMALDSCLLWRFRSFILSEFECLFLFQGDILLSVESIDDVPGGNERGIMFSHLPWRV